MGRVHSKALRRLGNIDVVGIAGSSQAKARRFADAVSVEYATSDYPELLAMPDLDAVHICSPNAFHFEMAMTRWKPEASSL